MKNRDKTLERKKQHRVKNQDTIKEKQKTKMTCECGCIVNKTNFARHRKTNNHLELLKQSQ